MEIVNNLKAECAAELAALPTQDALEQYHDRLESSLARHNQLARKLILQWVKLFY